MGRLIAQAVNVIQSTDDVRPVAAARYEDDWVVDGVTPPTEPFAQVRQIEQAAADLDHRQSHFGAPAARTANA
jgi:hypothetical protein